MKTSGSPRRRHRSTRVMAREYEFDCSKSRPNRFASRLPKEAVVVLDSDVAKVFGDSKRVNTLLRATIAALKKKRTRKAGWIDQPMLDSRGVHEYPVWLWVAPAV